MKNLPSVFFELPESVQKLLISQLNSDEKILAFLLLNLERSHLNYGEGIIVLTTEKLISIEHDSGISNHFPYLIYSWPYQDPPKFLVSEQAELVRLSLVEGKNIIHDWYLTYSCLGSIYQFLQNIEQPYSEEPEAEKSSDKNKKTGIKSPLIRLLSFAKPHRFKIALGLLLSIGSIGLGLIPPYLTMPLVDKVLIPYQTQVHDLEKSTTLMHVDEQRLRALPEFKAIQKNAQARFKIVPWYLSALALAAIFSWILAWWQGAILARVSERICAELRNKVFAHIQNLSLEYFGGKRTGDLIAKISTDTKQICEFLSDRLVDFIADTLMMIGTAVILLSINAQLALITLLPFPFMIWLLYYTRDHLSRGFSRSGRAWSQMTNILIDAIPGIRVVKAFVQEKMEVKRFTASNEKVIATNDLVNKIWTFFWPTITLVNQFGLLVVWVFGAWQVYNGDVSVGVLTAFLAYMTRFYTRLESMSRMYGASQKASASARRLFEILSQKPTVKEPLNPIFPEKINGAITLNKISFRYGKRVILNDLSLNIPAHKMLGIVGHSGAGKSTLINLICRFFDVSEGFISVDDIDIRNYDIATYRQHIGIVLQEPFLFYGTVSGNIAYGKTHATNGEIITAARAARAHRFIMHLPDAYDAVVSERGQSLSGGERQRISIARALLIDPAILILDEAMASVDTKTEHEIQAALNNLIKGRTTIAIAHRLSTLRQADNIVVLDQGKIVEQGTHDFLLKQKGIYAELYEAQMKTDVSVEIKELDHQLLEQKKLLDEKKSFALEDLVELIFDENHELRAKFNSGEWYQNIKLVKAYPLTDPNHWWSLIDASGDEILLIADPNTLSKKIQDHIQLYFKYYEFTPTVKKIISINAQATPMEWKVLTTRGEIIVLIENEESIRYLNNGKMILIDTQGMRYIIENIAELDQRSQSLLNPYL